MFEKTYIMHQDDCIDGDCMITNDSVITAKPGKNLKHLGWLSCHGRRHLQAISTIESLIEIQCVPKR